MKTSTQVYASSYPKSWLCSPRWLPVFHVISPPTVGWGCHRAGSSQRLRILRFNQEEGTLMQLKYRSARWRSRGNLLPSPSLGWPLHCRCDRRGFAPPVTPAQTFSASKAIAIRRVRSTSYDQETPKTLKHHDKSLKEILYGPEGKNPSLCGRFSSESASLHPRSGRAFGEN